MVLGWLRGNPSGAQNGKVIDGAHPEQATAEADALKPDLLPDEQTKDGALTRHNILVAVKGCELDREVVTLACKAAMHKKNATIYIVYVIEVPRTKAIDDPMTDETETAKQSLLKAAKVAKNAGITNIAREIVQSRDQGHSLVDEVEAHQCELLIVGLPFHEGIGGRIQGVEAVSYVLQHAPSKVWVVRDRHHEQAAPGEQPSAESSSEAPGATAASPAGSVRGTTAGEAAAERPTEHVVTR